MASLAALAALAAICLAGCSSSPEPAEPPQSTATSVVVLPEPQPQPPAQPQATPSTAASVNAWAAPIHDSEPEPEAQSICDIDPEVCKEPDPKTLAKCGCNRLVGRERARCMVDCVARERNKLDQKIRQP